MDIMVITDVERNDIEFISRTVGCQPVAHVDSMETCKLGEAALVEESSMPGATDKVVKVTGVLHPGRTSTILMRGGNKLVLAEVGGGGDDDVSRGSVGRLSTGGVVASRRITGAR